MNVPIKFLMRALRERYRDDSASLTKERSASELIIGCTHKFIKFSLLLLLHRNFTNFNTTSCSAAGLIP